MSSEVENPTETVDEEFEVANELPEGFIEERVQVDRRRLEQMILGSDEALPKAEDFFEEVKLRSGAQIQWPSRLKIGAKTKKDPFVKMIGENEQVKVARDLITAVLKVKKDRLTLKIEIPHAGHSHVIGRRGKNTQEIMQTTRCHIHFPDSNKHADAEKNNQVSIAGPTAQVEVARCKLREICPVTITVTADLDPSTLGCLESHRRALNHPDITVNVQQIAAGQVQWTIKASTFNQLGILQVTEKIRELSGLRTGDYFCRSIFELRPALLTPAYGLFGLNTIRWIALHTNTHMQFSPQDSFIVVLGEPLAILSARKYLSGLLPVSLIFDKQDVAQNPVEKGFIRRVEDEFNVKITEKPKSGGVGLESLFLIRTHEANLSAAYHVRQLILNEPAENIPDDYEFMKDMLQQIKQPNEQNILKPPPGIPIPLFSQSVNFNMIREPPDSPDPKESPIAHSLLAGVKSLNLNKNDIWRTPGFERQQSRQRNESSSNESANTSAPRQVEGQSPWHTGGFSSSLPANILRADLKEIWDKDGEKFDQSQRKADQGYNQSMSAGQKPLASVREEDELSDYNHSNSSNFSGSPLNRTGTQNTMPQRRSLLQSNFNQSLTQGFNQSANAFFDSTASSLGSDMNWDIRYHTDPQSVLAQVGCAEYLQQFREQEIDMQAFLLLDEHNLKDIGVNTMGARKKIYNAILKLRDSAERQGYRI
ncbi:unnamed protein product [Bursaphelenchus xylophilus]|uniref:(pine wood nematode) hypothetical protein n=1 Tax=Bursaphelenchus xylophilus TaxID=6326 RepID=A0A1I7RQT4_BURXY|nr:unnamed protein product [Bursaphelenchus xylophilus]CAG9113260.1 unnamed protein product [Bursaphelenchus xylophilus]